MGSMAQCSTAKVLLFKYKSYKMLIIVFSRTYFENTVKSRLFDCKSCFIVNDLNIQPQSYCSDMSDKITSHTQKLKKGKLFNHQAVVSNSSLINKNINDPINLHPLFKQTAAKRNNTWNCLSPFAVLLSLQEST